MLNAIRNFLFPKKADDALKFTDHTARVPEAPYKVEPPELTTKVDGIGHETVAAVVETPAEVKSPKKPSAKKPTAKKNTEESAPRKTTKKAK